MMEDEAVVRRQWLMRERFLDLLGVPNLLHGPRCGPLADGGVSGDGRRWGRGAPAAWQHLQAVAPATTRYSMRSPMTFAMKAACARALLHRLGELGRCASVEVRVATVRRGDRVRADRERADREHRLA